MRTSEVPNAGINEIVLYKMYQEEYLIKLQRGAYQLRDQKPLGNPDLIIVANKIPNGVILQYHITMKYDIDKSSQAVAQMQV